MIQQIEVPVHDPKGTMTPRAVVIGLFAIHLPTKIISKNGGPFERLRGWTVTHIPSGRCAADSVCCFAHAKDLVKALVECGADWNFGPVPSIPGTSHALFPKDMESSMEAAKEVTRSFWRIAVKCQQSRRRP